MSSEELGQWAGDCSAPRPVPLATGLAITICTRTPHDTQLRYTHITTNTELLLGLEQKEPKGIKRTKPFSPLDRGAVPQIIELPSYKILFKNSIIKRINNKIY